MEDHVSRAPVSLRVAKCISILYIYISIYIHVYTTLLYPVLIAKPRSWHNPDIQIPGVCHPCCSSSVEDPRRERGGCRCTAVEHVH